MNQWTIIILFSLILLFTVVFAYTHPGGTDNNGGHYNRETGEYHYHNGTNTDGATDTNEPAMSYPVEDFTQDTAYKIVRIVDGDTVIISYEGEDTSVRLIGIDTPEPNEDYGKEAASFIQNLLQGEFVYLRFGKEKTDIYGRMLAYLYRAPDGLFVNLEIVRQGYGRVETRFSFDLMNLFRNYNERAQIVQKGLWTNNKIEYHPADLNKDGVVNILDLVMVANAFSTGE